MNVCVEVTAEDIAAGKTMDPLGCIVALSILQALPRADFVAVGVDNAHLRIGQDRWEIALPGRVAWFIRWAMFCEGLPIPRRWLCWPFAFDWEIPVATGQEVPC